MQSNNELIEYLVHTGVLSDDAVIQAMKSVDRVKYVPSVHRNSAYADSPIPIGFGQTISAPHMVAIMSQHLGLHEGHKVLEVGAGSGYQAAILAELVGEKGRVYTVERAPELAAEAKRRLKDYFNVEVIVGNGAMGLKKHAPYNRMLVACAARNVPQALEEQLEEGGKMVIPIGRGAAARLTLVEKFAGTIKKIDLNCSCRFVALIE